MDHFLYRDGCLHAEDVAISQIAAEVGTPFYLYSSATLLRHFKLFDDALAGMDHLICYAMKAASNQAILTLLGAAGAGMDVVSGGEYARAQKGQNGLVRGRLHRVANKVIHTGQSVVKQLKMAQQCGRGIEIERRANFCCNL